MSHYDNENDRDYSDDEHDYVTSTEVNEANAILVDAGLEPLETYEDESELHEAYEESHMLGRDFDTVLDVWQKIRAEHSRDCRTAAVDGWQTATRRMG